jgi:hypothetical protein
MKSCGNVRRTQAYRERVIGAVDFAMLYSSWRKKLESGRPFWTLDPSHESRAQWR